jgi:hypothetical protein
MNLIELFDSLPLPEERKENIFNAIPIPNFPSFRIGIDIESNPVLLLTVKNPTKNISLKNFRLKYLQLSQNVVCKVTENNKTEHNIFTVINFTSNDRNLQEYFLIVAESLIKSINNLPTQEQIIESLNKFIELFRSLNDTPTNTIQGLWAELFLIEVSNDPKTLLHFWHSVPEEKFDFNSGPERIEVKSNSNFERLHYFSSEQLNPPKESQVIVASIFLKLDNSGLSIKQIIDKIINRIQDDTPLVERLNKIVCITLGNSLEQSLNIKYDYNVAIDSIKYYHNDDVKKIEAIYIPSEVSEVRFKSDLSQINNIDISQLQNPGFLFKALYFSS